MISFCNAIVGTFDKTYIRYLLAFVLGGDSKKMYSGDT